ncbi:MAG: hypothetical protein A2Y20_04085 [Firmicutes bacterium GWF2_51_9]|nr:MAG: hypothetical protein A2Y20_04085 [Firmicutes bacterium GWF2_51_9]OGS59608.1 MAG: hypothetical protein A2Y19_01665 [Firmicutes bacterium GWE2_51_13]HBZ41628.1 hypothetical protein [Erysipelotrichaceae bacterium]
MYYKVTVNIKGIDDEENRMKEMLKRVENAEMFFNEKFTEGKFALVISKLESSITQLIFWADEWMSTLDVQNHTRVFLETLDVEMIIDQTRVEEVMAFEMLAMLRDRPIDFGEVQFQTQSIKQALVHDSEDGITIEERYFDTTMAESEMNEIIDGMIDQNSFYEETFRILEGSREEIRSCYPIHYALLYKNSIDSEKAFNVLVNLLLENRRQRSRRVVKISLDYVKFNVYKMNTLLNTSKESIIQINFEKDFDQDFTTEFIIRLAEAFQPHFIDHQFIFTISNKQRMVIDKLNEHLISIPILALNVGQQSNISNERTSLAERLGKYGINNSDLFERFVRYKSKTQPDTNNDSDFQRVYRSQVITSIYPQYASSFPDMRIPEISGESSSEKLLQMFSTEEVKSEIDALKKLSRLFQEGFIKESGRVRVPKTYAVIGKRGTGHTEFVERHSAVLHELGFLEHRNIVRVDCFDLLSNCRKNSEVDLMTTFDTAKNGAIVIDLSGLYDYRFNEDLLRPIFTLLLNYSWNFGLYLLIESQDWESLMSDYPSLRFIIRQVFELDFLPLHEAWSIFKTTLTSSKIAYDPEIEVSFLEWVQENQVSEFYQYRKTIHSLVRDVIRYRGKWSYDLGKSTHYAKKEFLLDKGMLQIILRDKTSRLQFEYRYSDYL